MERFGDAARAYEKLLVLQPQDADAMADLADALAMVAGRRISGRSLDLVRSALALNPTQWKALAMAGTEAFERKDYRGAVDYWERLRGSVPADSQLAQSIGTSIDEARRLGGLAAAAPAPAIAATAPTAPPGSTAAAPATGATTPAPPASATAAAAAVSGELRLAPTLAQQVAPGDTVFVTARAAEGPRIPLAVKRLQVKDLPTAFRLDDSLAMAPNMKISAFPDVVITARVSRSGQATPQSGDLESTPLPTKNAASGLIVIIDRVVP
jgi:cytochrome c-type biogenesis protein CcmH